MSTENAAEALLHREVTKAEVIVGLRHALDATYRRFVDAARSDWERLIGADPSDACVTVRVHPDTATATRGSGFLKSRRQPVSKSPAKSSVPGFAH
jgi:hypothetical protein